MKGSGEREAEGKGKVGKLMRSANREREKFLLGLLLLLLIFFSDCNSVFASKEEEKHCFRTPPFAFLTGAALHNRLFFRFRPFLSSLIFFLPWLRYFQRPAKYFAFHADKGLLIIFVASFS